MASLLHYTWNLILIELCVIVLDVAVSVTGKAFTCVELCVIVLDVAVTGKAFT